MNERYRALFERSLDSVFLTDFEGNFLDANHAALDLLGYRREEIPFINFKTLLDPADLQRALASLAEVIRSGTQHETHEVTLNRKDGRKVIVEVKCSVVFEEGRASAVLGIARDVTARKRTDELLRESEERFRHITENIREVFWLTDPSKNQMLYISPTYELIWNRTRAELYASPRSWLDAIHPEDREHVLRAALQKQVAGNYDEEYRIIRPDGTLRWIRDQAFPVRNVAGEVYRIAGVAEDITERKHAEDLLRESEQRFRAMVEQSISGFYVIQDGVLVYVNSRMAEIFDYASPDEIVGKHHLELTVEKDRAIAAQNVRRRIAGEVKSISYSFTGVRKDGSEVEIGVHGSLATYQGRPAIIGLLQDISERKRAQNEIRRYVARLERAMQSTINVVATIGELRDPYTHGHERRVGEVAAAIAAEMGLDASRVEGVRIAGYLHDVGKIAVPAEILSKPAHLTKAEYELVKDHAQQSYEILKTMEFAWRIAESAWQHHERIDGSGYPRGLKDEEIILEARVLAVADTVEAMASHRPYRPGLGIDKALAEVEKGRSRLYDPQVVDACLRLFRENNYAIPA
ncbi:MAG: PAS domain S-box protein [Betaproteobacteria bacterium]|nr:PAS domain S-box protein [Betaproteobacteria bacterium]